MVSKKVQSLLNTGKIYHHWIISLHLNKILKLIFQIHLNISQDLIKAMLSSRLELSVRMDQLVEVPPEECLLTQLYRLLFRKNLLAILLMGVDFCQVLEKIRKILVKTKKKLMFIWIMLKLLDLWLLLLVLLLVLQILFILMVNSV